MDSWDKCLRQRNDGNVIIESLGIELGMNCVLGCPRAELQLLTIYISNTNLPLSKAICKKKERKNKMNNPNKKLQ